MAVLTIEKEKKGKRVRVFAADWYDGIKRHRKEFKTKQAAQDFEATVRTRKRDGVYMPVEEIPTFADVAVKLLASKESLRPGSWRNADTILRRHLLKRWGQMRLDRVTVPDIEAWARELAQRRSAGTVGNVMALGGAIFDQAIRHSQWMRPNPFRIAERPAKGVEEISDTERDHGDDEGEDAITEDEIYRPEEMAALLANADESLRVMFTMAVQTGMRRGELLALRWSNVTFQPDGSGTVRVRHSVTWAKGPGDEKPTPRLYPPKTKSGLRTIPFARSTATLLKASRLRNPGDLVFPGDAGSYLRPEFVLRGIARAAKRAQLKRALGFHSLRHYFCSGLIARGESPLKVQKWAGHKNVSMTLGVYSHWVKGLGSDKPVDLLGGGLDSEQTVSSHVDEASESAISA